MDTMKSICSCFVPYICFRQCNNPLLFRQEDSHSATLWKFAHSDVGGGRHRAVLKHGDPIRLFHENAGYLYGTGDYSSVKCKYYLSGQNETASSYKSMWIVESEGYSSSAAEGDVRSEYLTTCINSKQLTSKNSSCNRRPSLKYAGINQLSLDFLAPTNTYACVLRRLLAAKI